MNDLNSFPNLPVFLSYSHDDRELVEAIAKEIKEERFECWIDSECLRAQENYNYAIDKAIDDAIIFIAFLSKTYVNKKYCIHEFDRAIDKEKSIIVVCLDDVSEYTQRQCAYMFSFSAGHNILGFGKGIQNKNVKDVALNICESVPMQQLKGGEKPSINTPEYFLALLRKYHAIQYSQSGNYALNDIRGELFPSVKDSEIDIVYKDEVQNVSSLRKYIMDNELLNKRKHLFGKRVW